MVPWTGFQALRAGPIWPFDENIFNLTKKTSLLPHTYLREIKCLVIRSNCEIHGFLVRGSGSRSGPIWPHIDSIIFFLYYPIVEDILIVM